MSRSQFAAMAFLVMLAGVGLCPGTLWGVDPRALEFEPLLWDPPAPERVVLDNGLVVFLLEDDEVPLVEVAVYVRTGSVYERAETSGLARLTAKALRHGGAGARSADEIDRVLELMAAEFDIYMRATYAALALSVLRKDVDEGLGIVADVLRRPAFDPQAVELYRRERLEDIRRRYDRPRRIASSEFRKLVYGPDSPWSRMATSETVSNLTREDLVEFHSRYFRPNNSVVSISGDLTRAEMLEKVETLLGDWEPAEVAMPILPAVERRFEPSVNYIERKISQVHLRVGHLGCRRHDANEFAIEMMNYILGGGGFLSRLTREIRSRRGLAYSVQSRFEPGEDLGLFEVACETDAAKTHETLAQIVRMIGEMVEGPPTEEELARAKEARINEFVFAFDSRTRIVRQAAWLEYQGYPPGYLEGWVERVRAVTAEDVWRAAETYLHPDGLTILAVGDESRFARPLEEYGEVRRVRIDSEP